MNLKIFWNQLSKRRHKQLYLLLMLMILASLVEVVSIGAILPFLGVLTSPEQVFQYPLLQPIIQAIGIPNSAHLLFPVTILFIAAILIAGSVRLLLLYVITKLSYAIGADLSINIYRKTLYQEYSVHILRNSSEVINGITLKTNMVINGIVRPSLVFISSVIFIIAIFLALFAIEPKVASFATIGLGFIYLAVIWFTRQKVKENSSCIAKQSTQIVKALQEGLGGIRDVLIGNTQKFYCKLYQNADLPFRHASASNAFVNGAPRYVIESFGMVLIVILAYSMSLREGGLATVVPILGGLALGAQRLLPALQQAYGAYNRMKGSHSSFEDVLNLLTQPLPDYLDQPPLDPITFKKEIKINNLSFCYTAQGLPVIKNINLTFPKGSKIGFIGETGSGKSTLIDIIMCLLSPTEGELLVDGQKITVKNKILWQANIAHVPQSIYLTDGTIEENIAFGVSKDKINHKQVKKAAQQAQIAQLIEGWQEGYQTPVGERGVKLSGGQRQRIGIARAFYQQASVLIFDEATSALDVKTELAIMEAIEDLKDDLTILIIAHRVSTLEGCDMIVKLDKNNIVTTGSYQEMINI